MIDGKLNEIRVLMRQITKQSTKNQQMCKQIEQLTQIHQSSMEIEPFLQQIQQKLYGLHSQDQFEECKIELQQMIDELLNEEYVFDRTLTRAQRKKQPSRNKACSLASGDVLRVIQQNTGVPINVPPPQLQIQPPQPPTPQQFDKLNLKVTMASQRLLEQLQESRGVGQLVDQIYEDENVEVYIIQKQRNSCQLSDLTRVISAQCEQFKSPMRSGF